jgi:hypothetical protein
MIHNIVVWQPNQCSTPMEGCYFISFWLCCKHAPDSCRSKILIMTSRPWSVLSSSLVHLRLCLAIMLEYQFSISIFSWLIFLLVYEESLMLRRIWVRMNYMRPILPNPCISYGLGRRYVYLLSFFFFIRILFMCSKHSWLTWIF